MATGYFTHRDCWLHDMGAGHPECAKRLDAIEDRLVASGVMDLLQRHEAPQASIADLELAHQPEHIAAILKLDALAHAQVRQGGIGHVRIDADTLLCPLTWRAAMRASGAVVAATDMVISGELENAFCAVRPPGHHAERSQAMGFCFFNNVAVGALHALQRHQLKRVAVVDFDVHHGNGTEDILAEQPRTLMLGFFQHPFYPHSGEVAKADNMLNLPVPAHTNGMGVREVIDLMWLPRLDAFKPEMIFISAGFDAHREDDIAQLMLNEEDYVWITQTLVDAADRHAGGRIVSSLEGGYAPDALARSVEAHIRVLAKL